MARLRLSYLKETRIRDGNGLLPDATAGCARCRPPPTSASFSSAHRPWGRQGVAGWRGGRRGQGCSGDPGSGQGQALLAPKEGPPASLPQAARPAGHSLSGPLRSFFVALVRHRHDTEGHNNRNTLHAGIMHHAEAHAGRASLLLAGGGKGEASTPGGPGTRPCRTGTGLGPSDLLPLLPTCGAFARAVLCPWWAPASHLGTPG